MMGNHVNNPISCSYTAFTVNIHCLVETISRGCVQLMQCAVDAVVADIQADAVDAMR
jgi:hypothetical protein